MYLLIDFSAQFCNPSQTVVPGNLHRGQSHEVDPFLLVTDLDTPPPSQPSHSCWEPAMGPEHCPSVSAATHPRVRVTAVGTEDGRMSGTGGLWAPLLCCPQRQAVGPAAVLRGRAALGSERSRGGSPHASSVLSGQAEALLCRWAAGVQRVTEGPAREPLLPAPALVAHGCRWPGGGSLCAR